MSTQSRPHREPGQTQLPHLEPQHSALPILTLPSEALAGSCPWAACSVALLMTPRFWLPSPPRSRAPSLQPFGTKASTQGLEKRQPQMKSAGQPPWHGLNLPLQQGCLRCPLLLSVGNRRLQEAAPRRPCQDGHCSSHFLSTALCRALTPMSKGCPAPWQPLLVLWRLRAACLQVSNQTPHPDCTRNHGNCTCEWQSLEPG